jgi:hypothetical protein
MPQHRPVQIERESRIRRGLSKPARIRGDKPRKQRKRKILLSRMDCFEPAAAISAPTLSKGVASSVAPHLWQMESSLRQDARQEGHELMGGPT